jgi:hypothetical protein
MIMILRSFGTSQWFGSPTWHSWPFLFFLKFPSRHNLSKRQVVLLHHPRDHENTRTSKAASRSSITHRSPTFIIESLFPQSAISHAHSISLSMHPRMLFIQSHPVIPNEHTTPNHPTSQQSNKTYSSARVTRTPGLMQDDAVAAVQPHVPRLRVERGASWTVHAR